MHVLYIIWVLFVIDIKQIKNDAVYWECDFFILTIMLWKIKVYLKSNQRDIIQCWQLDSRDSDDDLL